MDVLEYMKSLSFLFVFFLHDTISTACRRRRTQPITSGFSLGDCNLALALLVEKRGDKLSKKFDPAWGDVNHVITDRRIYTKLWIGELFYLPRPTRVVAELAIFLSQLLPPTTTLFFYNLFFKKMCSWKNCIKKIFGSIF